MACNAGCGAGRRRHRVELQESTETGTTAHGHPILSWSTIARLWVAITPIGGREVEVARQLYSETTQKVEALYDSRITVGKRLKYGSRILHIGGLLNFDNARVELLCSEVLTP